MAYGKSRLTMPSNHHEQDVEWISSQLSRLTPAHQLKARAAYSDAYSEARNNEITEHKKDNKGRSEANKRLRVFVGECLELYLKEHQDKSGIRQVTQQESQFEW